MQKISDLRGDLSSRGDFRGAGVTRGPRGGSKWRKCLAVFTWPRSLGSWEEQHFLKVEYELKVDDEPVRVALSTKIRERIGTCGREEGFCGSRGLAGV